MGLLTSLFAFVLAVVIALPIRVYQLTAIVDYSTGFYSNGSLSNYAFIFAIIFLCVIVVAPIHLGWWKPEDCLIKQKYRTIGAFQALLGFSVVYEAGVTIGNFVVGQNAELFDMIIDMFGLAVGFILLIIGFNLMMGNLQTKPMSAVSLIPTVYYAIKMIRTYMQLRVITTASQNALTILFGVFMVLFMFSYARILSNVQTQKGILGCLLFGSLASTVSLVSVIPRMIVFWFAEMQPSEAVKFPEVSEIAACLFVTAFTVNLICQNIKKPEKKLVKTDAQ